MMQAAALGALRSADLQLEAGRYVVLSNEPGTLQAFCALLTGREAPRQGRVELDGAAPAGSPALRRRIAALFDDESLPPAATVLASLELALALRGGAPSSAMSLLEAAGLSRLSTLPSQQLGARDRRGVALALALSDERAALFVLHEPLGTSVPKARVIEALDQHTRRGALVVTCTASTADASDLGGEWLCIELGRLRAAATPHLGAGPWQQLLVETDDAAMLSRLLHGSAVELTTELYDARTLKVTGASLELTVRELIRVARAHAIEVHRLAPSAPPVDALLAARAGFARGAYEAARVAAHGVSALAMPPAIAGAPAATNPNHAAVTNPNHAAVTNPNHAAVTNPNHAAVTNPNHAAATNSNDVAATNPNDAAAMNSNDVPPPIGRPT